MQYGDMLLDYENRGRAPIDRCSAGVKCSPRRREAEVQAYERMVGAQWSGMRDDSDGARGSDRGESDLHEGGVEGIGLAGTIPSIGEGSWKEVASLRAGRFEGLPGMMGSLESR